VLGALGERLTNAEIAVRLFVSERTVESHVSALLRKLEASSRLELTQLARAHHRAAPRSLPGPLELLLDAGGYVGREAERERLRELWGRVLAGQMVVVVVSGEAGIGKSRLVAEFTGEVSGSARVLLGSCFEDSDAPYQPFVQAIESDIAEVSDATLRRWVDADASSLGRIVPEIERRCDRPSALGESDALDAQSGVAAAVCRYLTRSVADGPVVCVLEDVHWATATTLATVRFLARAATRAPVLVILTTRDTAPDLHEGLRIFLSELAQIPTVESIALAGLPEADVAALLDQLGATVDPAAVATDTKGNPLLVREVANSSPGTATSLYALLARRYSLLDAPDVLARFPPDPVEPDPETGAPVRVQPGRRPPAGSRGGVVRARLRRIPRAVRQRDPQRLHRHGGLPRCQWRSDRRCQPGDSNPVHHCAGPHTDAGGGLSGGGGCEPL
jgi:hypothetical protein